MLIEDTSITNKYVYVMTFMILVSENRFSFLSVAVQWLYTDLWLTVIYMSLLFLPCLCVGVRWVGGDAGQAGGEAPGAGGQSTEVTHPLIQHRRLTCCPLCSYALWGLTVQNRSKTVSIFSQNANTESDASLYFGHCFCPSLHLFVFAFGDGCCALCFIMIYFAKFCRILRSILMLL